MAIKSTLKNTNYNRKHLAKKLDDISTKVAARGIFVVRKNDYDQYDLYDVSHDAIIFDNLPNKHIAEKIRDKYNSNTKYHKKKQASIRKKCNDIGKHTTDCIYYLHTIQNSAEYQTVLSAETRLQYSKDQIQKLIRELSRNL